MLRELTIVVNCTERKSLRATPERQVRNLPTDEIDARFAAWHSRMTATGPALPLRQLYQGEAWMQAKELYRDADAAGYRVSMMVASAGLGLRTTESCAPGYSATFSSGHADSVASTPAGMCRWWHHLSGLEASMSLVESTSSRVLLVLSASYARAMHADLESLGRRGGEVLLFGGGQDIEGIRRVPSDRALRMELGGTASSLNLRMARAWIAQQDDGVLYGSGSQRRWLKWVESVRHVEAYDRTPAEDETVISVIRAFLSVDSSLSATRALRQFRDAGMACEQKRFGKLFRDAKDGI